MNSFPTVFMFVFANAIAILQASLTVAFVPSQLQSPNNPISKTLYHQIAMNCRTRCCTKRRASENRNGNGNENTEITTAVEVQDDFSLQTWNPLRLIVMKLGFTELRYTSPLNYEKRDGVYNCAYCGLDLFDSQGKYDSGSGWPSFWRSTREGNVAYKREFDGRLECLCANQKCSAHLGHVFLDGPRPGSVADEELVSSSPSTDPRGQNPNGPLPRFCVNGSALKFEETSRSNDAFPFAK